MTGNARNLTTSLAGLRLINPFLLASGPPAAHLEGIRRAFALGWAGAVLKTIAPAPETIRDASPRFAALRGPGGQVIGFENFELTSRQPLEYWVEGIASLKREFPDRAVVVSVTAPADRESWRRLVGELHAAPVDAFELNFSCPHGMPERGMGLAIGADPGLSAEITGWVKEFASVPVFVKLSPNVTNIAAVAQAVRGAGADGLAAINTIQCLMGVDLETLSPLPAVGGQTAFGGYSGFAAKPVGLRSVAQIATATGLPVMGMGGITGWRDAAEYLAIGSTAVQVCTEVMLNGYAIIRNLAAGLAGYLAEKGFADPQALSGLALAKVTSHQRIAGGAKRIPVVRAEVCRRCGKCAGICAESGFGALELKTGGELRVDAAKCDGCGLCAIVCPVGALR